MGRQINRLSARSVASLSTRGYHPDGGGLYLQVSPSRTKSWMFCFTRHGRAREMGLGPFALLSLAEARAEALRCRKLLHEGTDPIEARQQGRRTARGAGQPVVTFEACANDYVEAHRAGWRNAKHAEQWPSTLRTYAFPVLGGRPVAEVDTAAVMQVLEPIWRSKTETASRVRGRMEAVLAWAAVRHLRPSDNPARWHGHLDQLLPARARVRAVVHHPALPFDQMAGFVRLLRAQEGTAARGLMFQILTAARTGEVIGARWEEIDVGKRLWTVPAVRMKAHREHRVALSDAALGVLNEMREQRQSAFVFAGQRVDRPLSNMAFLALLRRMGRHDLTAHGFRSSFRDWAAERSSHPREVVEMALAHTIGDKVEAAYRRGDLFTKRCQLMQDWAAHCLAEQADPTLA